MIPRLLKTIGLAAISVWGFSLLTISCGQNSQGQSTEAPKSANVNNSNDKPLNLSIYLDLSDRLIKNDGPTNQIETDTALIHCIWDLFLNRCKTNILKSKDHFQIFFYPAPQQTNINVLAKDLNLDLSKVAVTEKKKKVMEFDNTYKDNIDAIYQSTLKTKKWVGSDIWGFFSNKKVDQYCMKDGYRNVLIIITDGYLFYAPNKIKEGNAYSYVLSQTLAVPNSSLIVKRDGLENLEVLVLELNPNSPKEYTRMTQVLSDWFSAMGVESVLLNETDIAANTEVVIESFLND